VRASVDVRVLVRVEVRDPVDGSLRLLGSGGVIKPDQVAPVHPLRQDREVPADDLDVELRRPTRQLWLRLGLRLMLVDQIERRRLGAVGV
jgi:hypothetical protein